MNTIVYSCPYIPAEWIAAHDLQPSRIIPSGKIKAGCLLGHIEGLCPYVRGFVNHIATNQEAAGVIVTTVCDQMRRAFDIIKGQCKMPAFLMNVPNTWQSPAVQQLYIDELKRLSGFLIRLGGKLPSEDKLAKIMFEYNTNRAAIVASQACLTPRQFSEAIAEFNKNPKYLIAKNDMSSEVSPEGIALAIVGGPLLKEDFEIFDVVEKSGGYIALDAMETGLRGICSNFDRQKSNKTPLLELSNAYFGNIPDASRRPNTQLYTWLESQLAINKIRGIIFRRYIWCDIWHGELHRLKQWTDLPVLDIDLSGDGQSLPGQTTKRIQAFLEMLQ